MPVALFTDPASLGHDTGSWHPESAERVRAVLRALEHPDFVPLLRERAPEATVEQLSRAHPVQFVNAILAVRPDPGDFVRIDGDTLMSAGTHDAILRGAGAAVAAVDAVMEGWAQAAFAAVRPPGHHAERKKAMGFCLFNNAAVAAMHARARWGLKRVAVADFDVHHGNGTQDIFWNEPDLFFASSHQYPCYPGTGLSHETGVAGNILNMQLSPGAGGVEFRRAWEREGLPALEAFKPELLILSAGFDAHRADPLAQLQLATEDYGWITDRFVAVADAHCGGRLVSVLEGGYDLGALAASVALHVRRLMRL